MEEGRWRRGFPSSPQKKRSYTTFNLSPMIHDNTKSESSLLQLQGSLNLFFRDRNMLRLALTHSSHTSSSGGTGNNERLEFLGDAVLDLVVSLKLFELYPDLPEGTLSRLRSSLVNEKHLALVARTLNLGNYLLLGKGEENSGGREKDSILASAYEALVGAVFVDCGIESASRMILEHFHEWLTKDMSVKAACDSKSQLQEKLQGEYGAPPKYVLVEARGPDHSKEFIVEVRFRGMLLGTGLAGSKKSAEKMAAKEALKLLQSGKIKFNRLQTGENNDD
jgi:ribonuclease-3